ncbi:DUF4384 domain-containing protein [Azospirillum sp. TSO22-1]|uniref:DUF4384 domain-containing protein n=1 Tax=Azospirillum sp. TSO22-1 TaxID=716789 RepID=UPI001304C537|nr:DUF4384 domain-containing protein [Azospirillum sp. TSO22-1]
MRHAARAALFALAACMPAMHGAAAADAVVIAATAPGYAPGQLIPDGTGVRLPDGASAHFLFANGRTLTVKGPYDGPLERQGGSGGNRLTDLLGRPLLAQDELAASRAVTPARTGGALPAVDPALGGTQCVPAGAPAMLRRTADPDLTLADPATGRRARVAWAPGEAEHPWPDSVAPVDGRTVEVISAGGRRSLVLRVVDPAGDTTALAVRLAAAGCTPQAAALLTPVRDALAPLDLYLSTDRGSYPSYQAGEPVRLLVQTNRDAHLACTLRDGRGTTVLLFPTGDSRGSQVSGHAPLLLPGDRMPMPLRASTDQEVRCYATERDLSDALPRTSGLVPLTAAEAERLERALAGAAGRLVMGQVILRVEAR